LAEARAAGDEPPPYLLAQRPWKPLGAPSPERHNGLSSLLSPYLFALGRGVVRAAPLA